MVTSMTVTAITIIIWVRIGLPCIYLDGIPLSHPIILGVTAASAFFSYRGDPLIADALQLVHLCAGEPPSAAPKLMSVTRSSIPHAFMQEFA